MWNGPYAAPERSKCLKTLISRARSCSAAYVASFSRYFSAVFRSNDRLPEGRRRCIGQESSGNGGLNNSTIISLHSCIGHTSTAPVSGIADSWRCRHSHHVKLNAFRRRRRRAPPPVSGHYGYKHRCEIESASDCATRLSFYARRFIPVDSIVASAFGSLSSALKASPQSTFNDVELHTYILTHTPTHTHTHDLSLSLSLVPVLLRSNYITLFKPQLLLNRTLKNIVKCYSINQSIEYL